MRNLQKPRCRQLAWQQSRFCRLAGKPLLRALTGAVFIAALAGATPAARAHGFAGARFFPPTIQTEDPFAADELAFPTISTFKNADRPAARETTVGFEFSKLILPDFSVGLEEAWVNQSAAGASVSGFENLAVNAKYQLWTSGPHEAVISAGAEWEIGGTGTKRIGAESASVFTPTIFFGKGLGDLPDALGYVRPFAVTGTLGQTFPTDAGANSLEWGFAVEYSVPYLQSQVKDIGLPAPFKNMIPVVEFAFSSPENRDGGPTTGTINPGILWESERLQIGAEAILPANNASGSGVGAVFQIQIYLDDLLPKMFGHPILFDENEN